MARKKFTFFKSPEYQKWFDNETIKSKIQINNRLSKIELEGYFGDHKLLQDDVWELKWINGRRLYYAYITELNILLLLGGNKNGQDKDITKAKKIFKKYTKNS